MRPYEILLDAALAVGNQHADRTRFDVIIRLIPGFQVFRCRLCRRFAIENGDDQLCVFLFCHTAFPLFRRTPTCSNNTSILYGHKVRQAELSALPAGPCACPCPNSFLHGVLTARRAAPHAGRAGACPLSIQAKAAGQ